MLSLRFFPKFIFAVFALTVAHSSWASISDITARIQKAAVVEGRFTQTEKLVSIPRPFQCEGFFISWKDDVLLWKTQNPIPTTTVYTDQSVKTYIHLNGKRIENTSASNTNIVNRILAGLLSADMTSLELDFQIFTQNNPNGWQINFYPKSNMTASIVKHISVSGKNTPEKIVVENFSDDVTTVIISNMTFAEMSTTRQENELANP